MSEPTERVRQFLTDHGIQTEIIAYPVTTRTAQQAAEAIGVAVSQIVKSLVFAADGQPCLVLCGGDRRVDPAKVAALLGARQVERAGAEQAKRWTGYAIGGVPPVAHAQPMPVLLDAGLFRHELVYAAAGTANTIFPITPAALAAAAAAQSGDVTAD